MNWPEYVSAMKNGVEFLCALASVVGLLGLVFGLIMFLLGGIQSRQSSIKIIVFSFIIVAIFGLQSGMKYFGMYR